MEARREQAMERLQGAFGEGDLTLSEYHERLELAARARDELDLALATRDLPAPASAAPTTPSEPQRAATLASRPVEGAAARPEATRARPMLALFSGVERRGVWEVPERLEAVSVFGGIPLDLRSAALAGPRTVIECVAPLGGVEVAVPPHVRVEVDGVGLFGGFIQDHGDAPLPGDDAPVVAVRGLALFGGVTVSTRAPERHPWKHLPPPTGRRRRREGRRGGRHPRR